MEFIVTFQWEIFIVLEVLSWVSLLLFGIVRYFLDRRQWSTLFILLFIVFLGLEALIGWLIYQETGEISNFQLIITVFLLYAVTLGLSDFKKLDRWMRDKIGNWRGVNLLTTEDLKKLKQAKDPKYIAKKYRISSIIHFLVFITVQAILWGYGSVDSLQDALHYLGDLSWIGAEDVARTPYANETAYGISTAWGIIFSIDFIYSWSYTIFPSASKKDYL